MKNIARNIEIHIALPECPETLMQIAFAVLQTVGFPKTKYFLSVSNFDGGTENHPTGHDLEHPGGMATVKVATLQEAVLLARAGMRVLSSLGLVGNFEIEKVVGSARSHDMIFDWGKVPEFAPVPDSPSHEAHLVWSGAPSELPTIEKIHAWLEGDLGQVVDFCAVKAPTETDKVSRVATIYCTSREQMLALANQYKKKRKEWNFKYHVAEQVIVVGAYHS